MSPENPCEVRPRSPQKRLEDARSQLLRNLFQKEEPIKRRSFWESQRKRWPEEATYLREEIAPEGYAGRVENIYGLNKNKQKFSQFQHSPSKQLQSRLKANARQAEAKETADKAVAKRRIQRGSLSNETAGGASGSARDWMAELERGTLHREPFCLITLTACRPELDGFMSRS
jgi:hypothetical protein